MPKHRGDLVSPNVLGQYRAEIPSQPEIKQEATARNIGSTTTKSSCTTFVSGCSLRIHFQWIENDYLHATIHCVSCSFFCSKRDCYISSFGLIAGVYYLYQSFCAFKSGIPFGEIGELNKAVCFIIFPFVAYLVSYVCEKIHIYFEENAY